MPWRIPYEDRALFPPDALRERAAMPAGVRLAFRSDTPWLRGAVVPFLEASNLDLCCDGQLINIYGAASLGPRTFLPALIGFVQILREKHPTTPLAILSPIYSPPRETTPNVVGFTLQAMREAVAEVVVLLQSRGDRHVHYVDGLRIFGPELGHLLPDDLHPNAEGYQILGQNFLREVAATVFPER